MVGMMQKLASLEVQPAPAWLQDTRSKGAALWRSALWPTRKTEWWKYTSLRALEQQDFFASTAPDTDFTPQDLVQYFGIQNIDAHRLVFVNGRYCSKLSDVAALPEGVELVTFAEANEAQTETIREHLDRAVQGEQHLFAALNSQLLSDGVFLHLKQNVRLAKPVHTVWLTTAAEQAFNASQRLLVVAEANSQGTVLEQFVSDDQRQNSLTHGVTELCLDDGAKLNHYRLHLEQEDALHIGGVHAVLNRASELNTFHLAKGGKLKRIDVMVNYWGEGAHCNMNGVYLPHREQHVDYHTCVEHRVPHCTTQEVFRGIIGDKARAVFNGRIHIHPKAQKTLAQLSNKNLLTSDKAEVDTKPELEIYADDVQCAHGATVAQLDQTAIHYLLTRGISRDEAEVILSFGFINELISQIDEKSVAEYLRPILALHFARDPSLTRHIA